MVDSGRYLPSDADEGWLSPKSNGCPTVCRFCKGKYPFFAIYISCVPSTTALISLQEYTWTCRRQLIQIEISSVALLVKVVALAKGFIYSTLLLVHYYITLPTIFITNVIFKEVFYNMVFLIDTSLLN